jgi:hypothetical protein
MPSDVRKVYDNPRSVLRFWGYAPKSQSRNLANQVRQWGAAPKRFLNL